MEINKNGALYKLAYFLEDPPEQVNLCQFFWRLVLMIIIVGPICLVVEALFGFSVNSNRFVVQWPKIRKFPLMPATVLPVLALLYAVCVGLCSLATWARYGHHNGNIFHAPGVALLLSIICTVLLLALAASAPFVYEKLDRAISNTEALQVFRAYLKARKEKFCPIITFVDKR